MNWLDQSIMRRRGVAQGRTPETHALTEALQGKYHYTIGPYSDPVLKIRPGDRVVVETRDAFEGKVKTEQDLPSRVLSMPFVNPQNGPIMVEGASKGDVLAVYIEKMSPRGANPRGTCAMIPQFGALSGTSLTALLAEDLPEIVRKVDVDEEGVYWSKRVTLIGDAHACQGDGEVCGTAVEFASTTTIHVDLITVVNAAMPHLEKSSKASIVTISSVSGREIDFASGPYGAFKAAIVHYTQGLAYHLAGKGIRANTVSPGNTYFPGGVWNQIETGNPEFFKMALGMNPTGRMGTPQEMANAAAFLASPAASFITGTNLVVDGALTKGVQL